MSITQARAFLKQTYSRWSSHNAPRLGASVAFYSILSIAPLLVLITAIIGLVFRHASAHGALVNEARQVIGNRGADTVNSLLNNAQKPASGTLASIIAFVLLLFGASGVFTELQDALNIMWDAPRQEASGFIGMIKQRLFSFGMVLSVGFLLLLSLLLSSGLAYIGHSFSQLLPLPPALLEFINFVVSFTVVTVLFALMFKYVPAVHVAWREAIVGAVGTALLFTIGKFLLSIYLGKASVGSTYGAAGSLVAIVVWIYYSAQIFFFGAEFTRVYADSRRGHTAPQEAARAPALIKETLATPVQTPEAVGTPKKMAATAGTSFQTAVPAQAFAGSRAEVVASSQPAITAPPPKQNVLQPLSRDVLVTTISRRIPSNPAKPRLLAAVVIGFLLGLLTRGVGKKTSRK